MQLCNLHRRKQGTVRTIDQFYDVYSSAPSLCSGNGGNTITKVLTMSKQKTIATLDEVRKGVVRIIGGRAYRFRIRKLTPTECCRLQGIPTWYDWGDISDTQRYRMLGNGWQVDTIKHCVSFMPKPQHPLTVLSLFDGMGCAYITLKELGIPVATYLSSEIDRAALKAERLNIPDIIQLGSVTDIDVAEMVREHGVPDVLFGGSPCQSFSMSGKMQGMKTTTDENIYTLPRYLELKQQGFQFEGQSYLFWEYMRILTELRAYNPGIYFFLENVEMQKVWERALSEAIGVYGVHINSALVSAQNRRRIYWSNFRTRPDGLFDSNAVTDIPQPADRGILLKDILEDSVPEKYYLSQPTTEKIFRLTPDEALAQYIKDDENIQR